MSQFLHSVRHGAGRTPLVVLSHALGLDHHMWDAIIAPLAQTHDVLVYDQRGHGRSPDPGPSGWSLDDLVEDAAALIRDRSDAPVVFIGLSMGGMVAQGLAIRHPDLLRAAVFAHTVASYSEPVRQGWMQRIRTVETAGMPAVLDTVVARYLGEAFRHQRPDAVAALKSQLLAMDPAAYAAACRAVSGVNWVPELPRIRCPVLVVAGRHDLGAPVEAAHSLAQATPGAQLAILEHSAHLSPVEEPERLASILQDFLRQLP